jgi:hypothetical protein
MSDFNVRADSVNVELIMEQIRERIREKRGVDYTEQQIRDLAAVKLEKFLDPSGVRSDLLDRFRKVLPAYEPPELPNFAFEDATLFESHRAPIRWLRKMLLPFLKLLFNPNPLIQALNIQSRLNTMNADREARRESARRAMDQLYYELIHNLVIETTRLGIDVKNLKMRLESVSSRLEFNERRARALESVVVYKPAEPPEERPVQRAPAQTQHRSAPQPSRDSHSHAAPSRSAPAQPPPALPPPTVAPVPATSQAQEPDASGQGAPAEGPGQRSRRRRRRRGRRGGGSAAAIMGTPGATTDASAATDSTEQMDALDRMDDDGSPESEDAHAVAAERVDHAAGAQAERSDPVVDSSAGPPSEATPEPTQGTTQASSTSSEQTSSAGAEQSASASAEQTPPAGADQPASASSEQPPSTGTDPAVSASSEQASSAGTDPAASAGPGQSPSTLREPQGGPDLSRGTTSSGQIVPDPDAQ